MGIIKSYASKVFALLLVAILLCGILPTIYATAAKTEVTGKVFEFDKDNSYNFSNSESFSETSADSTYGTFSIGANIANVGSNDGVTAYEIIDGEVAFFYNYSDAVLNADVDSWHLIDDKSKKINDLKLNSNIMKGAIVVQTSKDRLNWLNVSTITNAFSETPVRTDSIYKTEDIQLINGCFYRVIVAYELRIRTEDSNFLFINTDKYDYKKYAEVYEFYACSVNKGSDISNSNEKHSIGKMVKVKDFDGYSGEIFNEDSIEKEDAHYGWKLGEFFVSGYTDKIIKDGDPSTNVIFLKNVNDEVTLWFNLKQNINALNGNPKLLITADTKGSDQYFQTPTMDFGRGTLIIRKTDHNNVKEDPKCYTNYLEANVTIGADTKVKLFEEGDYEVALDYQVTNDQLLIDKVGHYRISFNFSVRNSNCMIYPFNLATGSELTNSSIAERGFRLDLANSKYLKITLKREVLKDSADGLVLDTRFNGATKDGAEYTDEGIYTITVRNEYTNATTEKKIYVGANNILKAHITTGLSIPEINNLVAEGATISNDGLITLASSAPSAPTPAENNTSPENHEQTNQDNLSNNSTAIYIIIGAVIVIAVCLLVFRKKLIKSAPVVNNLEKGDDEQ